MVLNSYLTARRQQCLVDNYLLRETNSVETLKVLQSRSQGFSAPRALKSPRNEVVGSIIGLIYVNDLPNCLESTTPRLYADDTQIFTTSFDANILANKYKFSFGSTYNRKVLSLLMATSLKAST